MCGKKIEMMFVAMADVYQENLRMLTGVFRNLSVAKKKFEASSEGI